jgi:hypothetical protein
MFSKELNCLRVTANSSEWRPDKGCVIERDKNLLHFKYNENETFYDQNFKNFVVDVTCQHIHHGHGVVFCEKYS